MGIRQVNVTVPDHPRARSEGIYEALKKNPHALCLVSFHGDGVYLFSLKCIGKHLGKVLETITTLGVGSRCSAGFGHIDVFALHSSIPRPTTYYKKVSNKKRVYAVSDRQSLEEIYQAVDSQIHLTFDYIVFVVAAAMIAAVGLLQDSDAVVVASMIVSPLMSPIMGITFGAVIRDSVLAWKSTRNEFIGVLVTFVVGAIAGVVTFPFHPPLVWPTTEMLTRGAPDSLIAGIAIAIPSGAGLAIAITGGMSTTLVGVAISAALLPPIVNSGMNLSFGLLITFVDERSDLGTEALKIASYSMALFLINFVIIFVVAMIMFKVKNISRYDYVTERGESDPEPADYSALNDSSRDRYGSVENQFFGAQFGASDPRHSQLQPSAIHIPSYEDEPIFSGRMGSAKFSDSATSMDNFGFGGSTGGSDAAVSAPDLVQNVPDDYDDNDDDDYEDDQYSRFRKPLLQQAREGL
eukprot:TRINITY_DN6289_c0_g1_i7.p1 TRINITY_DN6289_c0_g1~~TRINITY_DN6289_c0_g1_i7.p1  ORF type:complete len:465 (-),score=51.81 TRINITY_DN6289_c0_g1_i7:126-1520(-)